MANDLVPEFSVTDCDRSLRFYCGRLGFDLVYARPQEGFACIRLGTAEIMLDQIGLGRGFPNMPDARPFGRGVNLQIRVDDVGPLLAALGDVALSLPLEDRWYRCDSIEMGNRQFVVADPDGYLLRFWQDLGEREVRGDAV